MERYWSSRKVYLGAYEVRTRSELASSNSLGNDQVSFPWLSSYQTSLSNAERVAHIGTAGPEIQEPPEGSSGRFSPYQRVVLGDRVQGLSHWRRGFPLRIVARGARFYG